MGNLLPRIFFGISKTLPPVVGGLSKLPVKKSGMGINHPVMSAADKYTKSLCASYELIDVVTIKRDFQALITFGRLKRRGRMGKNIGITLMMENSG